MALVYIATKDKELSSSLEDLLNRAGFSSVAFKLSELMLIPVERERPLCILAGEHAEKSETTSLISNIKGKWPNAPIIVVSKNGELSHAVNALHAGAFDYLEAPVVDRILLKSLRDAITSLKEP